MRPEHIANSPSANNPNRCQWFAFPARARCNSQSGSELAQRVIIELKIALKSVQKDATLDILDFITWAQVDDNSEFDTTER